MAQKIATIIAENGDTIYPNTTVDSIVDSVNLAKKTDLKEVNDNIDQFKKSNTTWSPWSKDGMSLLNGAQTYNGDWDYPQYRTRKINGVLQVEITFRIKNVKAEGDTSYVGYPINLKPEFMSHHGYSFPTTGGRIASWGIGEGTIGLHATNDHNMDAGYWYPFYAQWEVQL